LPGTDHGLELQEVADDDGIQYIRLHLQQVVTPTSIVFLCRTKRDWSSFPASSN
jgi:hypothetical protein